MTKTTNTTLKAIKNYRTKKDIIYIYLDKGYKQKIKMKLKDGETISAYIKSLIDKDENGTF